MSLPVLPNPSNLVAVALVVNRTRDGASLVFHYPPEASLDCIVPVSGSPRGHFAHGDMILERLSTDPSQPQGQGFNASRGLDERLAQGSSGGAAAPWESVTGFPAGDLASLLSPGRPYHRTLFQVSLDPLHYVSCPVHVPENGIWRKKKKGELNQKSKMHSAVNLHELESSAKAGNDAPSKEDSNPHAEELPEGKGAPSEEEDKDDKDDKGDKGDKEDKDDKDDKDDKEEKEEKVSSMTMFNVVFILNPKQHEARELVNGLYSNIIKKVNKAYKYCQQHSDFVWKESKRIIRMKEKAKEERTPMSEVWKEILKVSSLAASIQEIYTSLAQNRIISLMLNTASGPLSMSMQIPVPFYIPDLGPEDETRQHGLWLTSANTYIPEEADEEPEYLEKNFALLLMDDEKKIISQLQTDLDRSTIAMVEFVRLCKPTMSLYQIGQGNILSHSQVRRYAHHFISWRRAIAIPPLHARDVYIMSPNCDLTRIPRAAQEWARSFPLAPPLTNFLAELSYAPRPYKHFCPSKAHRPNYLAMLAWLMRGGWVTQLCTFAYVVVWPEIIYEVEHGLEAEALQKEKPAEDPPASTSPEESMKSLNNESPPEEEPAPSSDPSERTAPGASTSADSSHTESDPTATAAELIAEKARLERMASKAQREAAEKATAHARKPVPSRTAHPSRNDPPHLAHMSPYIILDAGRATGRDSLYLEAIGRRFADERTAKAWTRFWRYFDGRSALERIALQEDMKRKEAWNLLTGMSEYLLCVRHW